jgi:hypothetical protein
LTPLSTSALSQRYCRDAGDFLHWKTQVAAVHESERNFRVKAPEGFSQLRIKDYPRIQARLRFDGAAAKKRK